MVGGDDFGDCWVIHALHGGPLPDCSVRKAEMGADRSGAGMWATGNAAGGLPLSVETPSAIIGWRVGFSLRLSKDWCVLARGTSSNRIRASLFRSDVFLDHLTDNCPKPLPASFGTVHALPVPEPWEALHILIPFSCPARGASMQKSISARGLYCRSP